MVLLKKCKHLLTFLLLDSPFFGVRTCNNFPLPLAVNLPSHIPEGRQTVLAVSPSLPFQIEMDESWGLISFQNIYSLNPGWNLNFEAQAHF